MGERLAAARGAAGLSIRRAAKVAGIPAVVWADMERGERSGGGRIGADDAVVARAAEAVGIDASELFDALGRATTTSGPAYVRISVVALADLESRLRRTEAALAALAERFGVPLEEVVVERAEGLVIDPPSMAP